MGLFNKLKSLVFGNSKQHIQTFTYFIPAPPARKSGYREKNFDNLVKELNELGFSVVDIKTQAISGNEQPGLWIIMTLKAENENALNLSPSDFPREFLSQNEGFISSDHQLENEGKTIELPQETADGSLKDDVEGIYYID